MIADSTFVSDFLKERRLGKTGAATKFIQANRAGKIRTTIITVGEIAVMFPNAATAWAFFDHWEIYRLSVGAVDAAADIDRQQIRSGFRLGENDNWIAGFARYYREPIISRDAGFDSAKGLRRITY